MAPRNKLAKIFAGALYQFQLFENKRKEQSTQVMTCKPVVFSQWTALTWPFAIRYEKMRLKHATLLVKLPYIVDNTSPGAAWMKKARAQVSCKGVQCEMRHIWEDYLHEVLSNQIETSWPRNVQPQLHCTIRNGMLCNNAMFPKARLALWLCGTK